MRQGRAAVIGMFDGVHRGHRFLLDCLRKESHLRGLTPEIFTFPGHPLSVVAPGKAPRLLTEPEEKLRLLTEAGFPVNHINFMVFDEYTRALTADRFMEMLSAKYGVRLIVRGFNNRFGTERHLTAEDYRRLAADHGIELIDALPYMGEGTEPIEISSSVIRQKLEQGNVQEAVCLLGHPYSLSGSVVSGKQLGRRIGFPTANIVCPHPSKLIPPDGVYVCKAFTETISGVSETSVRAFRAMVNIGSRPTVDGPGAIRTIEAHILDFREDLYGKELTLWFYGRLRDEVRFGSIGELELQLEKDCEETQKFTIPD